MWAMCSCFNKVSFKDGVGDLICRSASFVFLPTIEGGSAILFSLGRLLGSIVGKKYIRIPGDRPHLNILRYNMSVRGCAGIRGFCCKKK